MNTLCAFIIQFEKLNYDNLRIATRKRMRIRYHCVIILNAADPKRSASRLSVKRSQGQNHSTGILIKRFCHHLVHQWTSSVKPVVYLEFRRSSEDRV